LQIVTQTIFPMMQMWTRDFASKAGLFLEPLAKDFAREIYKANLSDQAIHAGIERFKAGAAEKPFMPNPAEFVELCLMPVVDGAPDERKAYKEACASAGFLSDAKWSHPAVYVAGKATGWYDLRNKPEKETLPIFKAEYKKALQRCAAGEDLAALVPVAAIEDRSIFQAPLDTPGRLKALAILGKKP